MKKSISRRCLGVVALLCSSAGFAAMVNVVPSNANPNVGDSFFVTVSGAGFPETGGATLRLTFNSAVVSVTSVVPAPGSPFAGGVVATLPFHSDDLITALSPISGAQPKGDFDAFVINFKMIAPGTPNIILVDDGGGMTWLDENAEPIPVTYHQANFNLRPVGVTATDSSTTTPRDTPVTIDVLANDTGVFTPATVTVSANPLYGAAVVSGSPGEPSGIRITYTPVAGFVGTDSFGYTVATNAGSASATVTITVIQPQPPGVTDTATTKINTPRSISYWTLLLSVAAVGVIIYLWRRRR